MALAKKALNLTVEEYLQAEKDSPMKHEYVDGQIFAMAGASKPHMRIAGNLYSLLDAHLSDGKCEAFIADMRVRVSQSLFYYPNVVVACDDTDPYYTNEPLLVVEVFSPSTERTDRHEKLPAYKRCKKLFSLRKIVCISKSIAAKATTLGKLKS